MKRIRCPKCDEPILFDDTLYEPGRTLVFECKACHKQFKLRVGPAPHQEEQEEEAAPVLARLVVIENAFHLKQVIPLYEGDNIVGRHVPGTKANAAIKTVDPSVDTTHCIIAIKRNSRRGTTDYILRDANSNTGTFLQTNVLSPRAQVKIEDGAIITLGATTIIFREGDGDKDDED